MEMPQRTSFRLTLDAIGDAQALSDGLRLGTGRIVELALKRLESSWRAGKLKVPAFPRGGDKRIFGVVMTNEALAVLDRVAPGLKLSRSKVVELALRRAGKEWTAGRIADISLVGSGR
jgi:hypothetical protein